MFEKSVILDEIDRAFLHARHFKDTHTRFSCVDSTTDSFIHELLIINKKFSFDKH